jgi:hypothetical protein
MNRATGTSGLSGENVAVALTLALLPCSRGQAALASRAVRTSWPAHTGQAVRFSGGRLD